MVVRCVGQSGPLLLRRPFQSEMDGARRNIRIAARAEHRHVVPFRLDRRLPALARGLQWKHMSPKQMSIQFFKRWWYMFGKVPMPHAAIPTPKTVCLDERQREPSCVDDCAITGRQPAAGALAAAAFAALGLRQS